MKTRLSVSVLAVLILSATGLAQEKTKKELKEEEKQLKIQQIETLVNSQDFVFKARYAMPMGMQQVDLLSNPNYVKFNPDEMDGYMPFFGQANASVAITGDNTIKFKDKPETFSVEKKKKNFLVEARVNGERDVYRLSLTVTPEGSSSLSITSNNRGSISYQGEIFTPGAIKY